MSVAPLDALLGARQFLPRSGTATAAALGVVPELAEGLPTFAPGGRLRTAVDPSLSALAAAHLGRLVDEVLAGRPPEAGDELPIEVESRLRAALRVSPAAVDQVALQVLRACVDALTGERAVEGMATLRAKSPEVQGTLLERVVGATQARLASVLGRLAADGSAVPGLTQALFGARLVYAFAAGPLNLPANLPVLAGLLRIGLPGTLADGVLATARAAVTGAVDRRAKGKETADDQVLLLRFVPPDVLADGLPAAVERLAYDVDGVTFLLAAPARWVDAKALAASGVNADTARQLLTPGAGLAVAATWAELLGHLARWEVLAGLVGGLGDVEASEVGFAPAMLGNVAVAAVAIGRLRAAVSADRRPALEAAWRRAVEGAGAIVAQDSGSHGILVFASVSQALVFAARLPWHLAELRRRCAVGVGWGTLGGAEEGDGVRLWGAAVEQALRWTASTDRPPVKGPRRLGGQDGALAGDGIAISEQARAVLEREGALPSRAPAGSVRAGAELGLAVEVDEDVVALVRVEGQRGGWEGVRFRLPDWLALPTGGGAAARPAPAQKAGARSVVAAPGAARGAGRAAARAGGGGRDDGVGDTLVPTGDAGWGAPSGPGEAGGWDGPAPTSGDPFAAAPAAPISSGAGGSARSAAPQGDPFAPASAPGGATDPFAPPPGDPFVAARPAAPTGDPFVSVHPVAAAVGDPFRDAPPAAVPPAAAPPAAAPEQDDPIAFLGPPPLVSPAEDPEGLLPALDVEIYAGEPVPEGAAPASMTASDPFASASPAAPSDRAAVRDPFADADPVVSTPPRAVVDPFSATVAPPALAEAVLPDLDFGEFGDVYGGAGPAEPAPSPSAPSASAPSSSAPSASAPSAASPSPAPRRAADPGASALAAARAFYGTSSAPEPEDDWLSDLGADNAPPEVEVAPKSPPRRAVRSGSFAVPITQVQSMFQGYVVVDANGEAVFGQPYGARLVDRHVYPRGADLDDAYRAFLKEKIAEGFVPRADFVGTMPAGVVSAPLDYERMARVWQTL